MAERLVRDLMHIGVPTCRDDTPLRQAARLMAGQGAEALIVMDENGMAYGLVRDVDLVRAYVSGKTDPTVNGGACTVGDIVDEDVPQVSLLVPARTAAQIMLDRGERALYLMHAAPGPPRPSAMVRIADIVRLIAEEEQGTDKR